VPGSWVSLFSANQQLCNICAPPTIVIPSGATRFSLPRRSLARRVAQSRDRSSVSLPLFSSAFLSSVFLCALCVLLSVTSVLRVPVFFRPEKTRRPHLLETLPGAWVLGFFSVCEPACPLRPRRHPRATKRCHPDRIISDCPVINDEWTAGQRISREPPVAFVESAPERIVLMCSTNTVSS